MFKVKKALAEHESKVYEKRIIFKVILPSNLLPSFLLFKRIAVFNTQKECLGNTHKKIGKFVERTRASTI